MGRWLILPLVRFHARWLGRRQTGPWPSYTYATPPGAVMSYLLPYASSPGATGTDTITLKYGDVSDGVVAVAKYNMHLHNEYEAISASGRTSQWFDYGVSISQCARDGLDQPYISDINCPFWADLTSAGIAGASILSNYPFPSKYSLAGVLIAAAGLVASDFGPKHMSGSTNFAGSWGDPDAEFPDSPGHMPPASWAAGQSYNPAMANYYMVPMWREYYSCLNYMVDQWESTGYVGQLPKTILRDSSGKAVGVYFLNPPI